VEFKVETIKVLQTTAVFHSLHQRQDKALADQEQMIRIITTVDLSETEYEELTAIKILWRLTLNQLISWSKVMIHYLSNPQLHMLYYDKPSNDLKLI
jgi:hypothetical protein